MSDLKRYYTISKADIDNTLRLLVKAKPLGRVTYKNYAMVTDTDRYENLYTHGCKCAMCGLEASFAAIEKNRYGKKSKYHLNVYVIAPDGKELVLTKDHIYPRALGGYDDLHNYQVLCERCNTKKGDKTFITPEEAVSKGYTSQERADLVQLIQAEKEKQSELAKQLHQQQQRVARLMERYTLLVPARDKSEFKY